MITKLLDSQSFSKVWKTAVRQTLCAIELNRVTLSADRLGDTSCLLIRRISLQALRKITSVIWSYDLDRVTMWDRKLYEMLHSALLPEASKNTGPDNSTIFNGPINRSQCFGGHRVAKTTNVLHSYQGFWYFAWSRSREFQVNPRNPAKFTKTRKFPRNSPEILPNTC